MSTQEEEEEGRSSGDEFYLQACPDDSMYSSDGDSASSLPDINHEGDEADASRGQDKIKSKSARSATRGTPKTKRDNAVLKAEDVKEGKRAPAQALAQAPAPDPTLETIASIDNVSLRYRYTTWKGWTCKEKGKRGLYPH